MNKNTDHIRIWTKTSRYKAITFLKLNEMLTTFSTLDHTEIYLKPVPEN